MEVRKSKALAVGLLAAGIIVALVAVFLARCGKSEGSVTRKQAAYHREFCRMTRLTIHSGITALTTESIVDGKKLAVDAFKNERLFYGKESARICLRDQLPQLEDCRFDDRACVLAQMRIYYAAINKLYPAE